MGYAAWKSQYQSGCSYRGTGGLLLCNFLFLILNQLIENNIYSMSYIVNDYFKPSRRSFDRLRNEPRGRVLPRNDTTLFTLLRNDICPLQLIMPRDRLIQIKRQKKRFAPFAFSIHLLLTNLFPANNVYYPLHRRQQACKPFRLLRLDPEYLIR